MVKSKEESEPLIAKEEVPEQNENERDELSYSCEKVLEEAGLGRYQLYLFLAAGIVWMMEGAEIILISFLVPVLQVEWSLSPWIATLLVACSFIGMMTSSFFAGYLSDRFGRRP